MWLAIIEHALQSRLARSRVDRHQDTTGFQDGPCGHRRLRGVRYHHRHAVARHGARVAKSASKPQGLRLQLGVTQAHITGHHSRFVGMNERARSQKMMQHGQ